MSLLEQYQVEPFASINLNSEDVESMKDGPEPLESSNERHRNRRDRRDRRERHRRQRDRREIQYIGYGDRRRPSRYIRPPPTVYTQPVVYRQKVIYDNNTPQEEEQSLWSKYGELIGGVLLVLFIIFVVLTLFNSRR